MKGSGKDVFRVRRQGQIILGLGAAVGYLDLSS